MVSRRQVLAAAGLWACGEFLLACGAGSARRVVVFYAASLTELMETRLGPAFAAATGQRLEGTSGGSTDLAQRIAGGLAAVDVFISASAAANKPLQQNPPHGAISWFVEFATSPLVVGYSPKSRFAADFLAKPWYQVLAEPGLLLGRTDPALDPKGTLVLQLIAAEAVALGQPGLQAQLLGPDDNPAQVFPEQDLVGRLQSGQLDAGFFYHNEAVTAQIPFVTPAAAVDPAADFTLALPSGGHNPDGARALATYLLGTAGRRVMTAGGLVVPASPALSGDRSAIPAWMAALVPPGP